jgi:hypothetical protein
MKFKWSWDNLVLGAFCGIIAPWIVMLFYYRINYYHLPPGTFLHKTFYEIVFIPLLSLCVIGNLGVFFLFIWTDKYKSARGVLFATMLYAIGVFIAKFLQ